MSAVTQSVTQPVQVETPFSFPSARFCSSAVTPVTQSVHVETVTKPTLDVTKPKATPEQLALRKKFKRKVPKPSSFKKLRLKVGLSVSACAELCGVTTRTVTNWDSKGSPLIAMRFLHIYDRDDLSGKGPGWDGWRFSRGKLCKGNKLAFSSRQLEFFPLYVDLYGRLEGAELRYRDGLPLEASLQILFGAPIFKNLPLLEHCQA
jgi:DNA-binding transcriptional regulator YiaG